MESKLQKYYAKWAAEIKAEGEVKPEKIDEYHRRYLQGSNYDRRYFYSSIKPTYEDGRILLAGEAHYREQVYGFENLLKALGFEVEDQVQLRTEGNLGDKSYAIVKTPILSCYIEPDPSTELVTQARFGERVQVLTESRNGYRLIRSNDAYLGWGLEAELEFCPLERWLTWENCDKMLFVIPYEHSEVNIPAGTELPLRDGNTVEFPDGSLVVLEKRPGTEKGFEVLLKETTKEIRDRIITVARSWLGTKYVWGAKTNIGTDCSGFVQTMYSMCGIYLPRDARHQFLVGRVCGGRDFMQMLPGDLLFFLGRNSIVTHVAISLGGKDFIHAGGGRVHEASLDQGHQEFQEGRLASFFCGKRILAC